MRIKALPQGSPLHLAVQAAQVEREEQAQVDELDDVLAMVQPNSEG